MISSEDVFAPSSHVAFRKIADQFVIVQPLKDSMLTLNETGTAIWGMLDGRNVDTLAIEISSLFDVSYETSLKDAKGFLEDMQNRGLVELVKE